MRRFYLGLTLGCAVVCGLGCSAQRGPDLVPPAAESWPQPPAESELAQIDRGMTQQQVMSVLGPPDGITNASAKVSDPNEIGAPRRTVYVYEGLGQVVFSLGSAGTGGTTALGVYYDPTETGVSD